jgi:hypothetical protein
MLSRTGGGSILVIIGRTRDEMQDGDSIRTNELASLAPKNICQGPI